MAKLLNLLVFNKSDNVVRRGFIFFCVNILILSLLVFTAEIVLILLGIGDIFLPLTRSAQDFLTKLIL